MKKNNKKTMLYIIIILLLVIIISVVGLLLNNKKIKESFSRTVMIYMVGSDLETRNGLATVDLNGIDYEKTTENNVNVLLIAGGSKKWHNDYIDKSETSIYKLESNGFVKVKEQELQSMGKPNVLSDFINYVYENYQTDKYDLIFWNHGGAIAGSEYDELNNYDNLSLNELNEALSNTKFNSNNKLELVFFNTCLNGTIEVANTFKDYSDYLVASEETTLGSPYTSELQFINNIETTDDQIDVGKKFISTYKDKIRVIKEKSIFEDDSAIYSTYSLIDLSNVDELTNSVSEFFKEIDVEDNFNQISKARANLLQYGESAPSYDMVDLYNLVDELKEISPKKADNVFKSFEKTIIYNWATDNRSRGMSIYFPYKGKAKEKNALLKIYEGFEQLTDYKEFIKSFNTLKASGVTNKQTYYKNAVNVETNKNKESDFEIELTDEQLKTYAKASYVVYRKNDDGYYKPIYSGGKAELDGNTIKASIRNKQLKVTSKTEKNEEHTLILFEKDENDKYVKYETNVKLQKIGEDFSDWKFDDAIINLLYDKENKKIDVISTVYEEDEFASSAVVDLSEYDSVAFSISSGWDILDENGNYVGPQIENGSVKGDGVITGFEEKPGNYQFELENFNNNYEYYCVFAITDTYGNISFTKLVKMN